MSKEEMIHAKILVPMHDVLDEGYLLNNIGEFHEDQIRGEVDEVKFAIAKAEKRQVKLKEAVQCAMNFETSIIDSQFYAVVECDSPVFKKVAEVHFKHGGHHAKEVHALWEAVQSDT